MATSSLPPKLFVDGDMRGCFYQTPNSSSATRSLSRSTTHHHPRKTRDDSRKRAREEVYTTSASATPLSESTPGWIAFSSATQTPTSPPPLVNSKYDLAHGFETPTSAGVAMFDDPNGFSDLRYRHGHWNAHLDDSATSYFPSAPNPLARERNGHARVQQQQELDPGAPWTLSVLSALNSVATKVISFCTTVPFRGFYSGGGQGYAMSTASLDVGSSQALGDSWHAIGTPDITYLTSRSPVPGRFPSENFIPDYMSSPSAHTRPRESGSSKKHKRESSSESISQEKWVLVDGTRTRSPLPSAASPVSSRRPASRAGMRRVLAPPRVKALGAHGPASTAALRSPGSTPKRMRLNRDSEDSELLGKPSTPGRQGSATADSPVLSPVALEARRYAEKVRRKDAEENRGLKKLNARLKDMIREGNEALGTRVSVDTISEDESDGW